MSIPQELGYTREHEWVRRDGDQATVGITAYAAEKLGDIVYIELPAVGTRVEAGTVVGEIESTKSVGELFAPVTGVVSAINESVVAAPELVNQSPFGEGWLVTISVEGEPVLLSAAEYAAITGD